MSLNTSHANGGVLIYNGEAILIYCDNAEMSLSNNEGHTPAFKGNKKGRVYLTTHRVIFNTKDSREVLQSFSMPFHCMKQVELEQPVFGANYIKGKVCPEAGGNWQGLATFKVWFNSGGAIEFGQAMLRAGQMASRNRPAQPPAYTAPPAGNYYQAAPPAYTPTAQYDFIPYTAFPSAPPVESVYTTDAPPPYPGIEGQARPSAPPMTTPNAGAGYYNPTNPHNVYATAPPNHMEQPPPYSELSKKRD